MSLTLAPKTLTNQEIDAVLFVSASSPRDHLIIRVAIGTSLRLAEIISLNVGQVYLDGKTVARTLVKVKGGDIEDVMFSTRLQSYIADFISWKIKNGEPVQPGSPLFLSNRRKRISARRVQTVFRELQQKAGLARIHNFHSMRHTAITIHNEIQGGDIIATQRFARHKDVRTTLRYIHPSDQRLRESIEALPY